MTAAGLTPPDPGATPTSARSLAPDLARGGMLLLIALANVHTYLYGRDGVRGYPAELGVVDQVVVLLQMLLVDGRAYPLFGLLFGYGITQLAWRRAALGMPAAVVERLVRRRGLWMVAIGAMHGLLLFSGDIVGAYGLLAVAAAGLLVTGSNRALLTAAAAGIAFSTLLGSTVGLPVPPGAPRSVSTADPGGAALLRVVEWTLSGLFVQALVVFGAVALGAWAARHRILDEPAVHRRMLSRVAVLGVGGGALLGMPFALLTAEFAEQGIGLRLVGAGLHGLGGFTAGAGYAALFGLLAIRLTRPGPLTGGLVACGRRSLSCYLAQSVVFVALLPASTLALGGGATVWQVSLLAAGVWAVVVAVAAASERAGHRGPAETLLRRLTYGRPGRALPFGSVDPAPALPSSHERRAQRGETMSQPPTPSGDGEQPSWMGAPGYTPHPENLAPHAPMPGAPPYPPHEEHPPPPVGARTGRTRYPRALLATLVWAAANLIVTIAVLGPPASSRSAGRTTGDMLIPALVASLFTWLVVRRRGWPFWGVVLVAAPFYFLLRLGFVLLSAAGS